MVRVRDLSPDDAPALTDLYGEYGWWADRRGESLGETLMAAVVDHPDLRSVVGLSLLCRRGLVPFYESVGFELYDGEIEVLEGGTETLVGMTYRMEG